MMRHFSSRVGVQRLGPNQCRLEMSLLMQPSIYIPFGVRHMVGGQVRTRGGSSSTSGFAVAGLGFLL